MEALAKKELERIGYLVLVPEMPNIDTPIIEKWCEYLSTIVGTADQDTYFIGHSIGCQTILRYLETIDARVGGAIFVAGWFDLAYVESDEVKQIAEPWIKKTIDFKKVTKVLPRSVAILSDNDVYVSLEPTKAIFEDELHSHVLVLHHAGHITAEDGFTRLPEVIDQLNFLTNSSGEELTA